MITKSTTLLIFAATFFLILCVFMIGCGPEWILLSRMKELKEYGTSGDAFGGSLGPLVGLLGAAITFLAFWIQFRANEIQKTAIEKQEATVRKQEIDLARERFESKFYKQIEILKSNISEIGVGKSINGRKTFISFFNELKFIYHVVNYHYHRVYYPTFRNEISEEAIYNLAYLIFFFGVGPNSTLLVRSFLNPNLLQFFENALVDLQANQTLWKNERLNNNPIAVPVYPYNAETLDYTLDLKYKPGNGHVSKLSHYVRHLFQTVKFVDSANEKIITAEMKYEYISILRSQLSPHEQLFIYYNAISILGKPWIEQVNYIKKYCLIKSSLIPLADFYMTPEDVFGVTNDDNRPLFEWNEIRQRLEAL